MSAALLAALLREPAGVAGLNGQQWNGVIAAARAERLLATLALRLAGQSVPPGVEANFADALFDAKRERLHALWEADRAARALGHLDVPVILLKGTAYAAADLDAGKGRLIGDLDILVPRDGLADVEEALLTAGWEWVKPDPYDNDYYRRWMHELPPLIHRERDRMIDVHHTILPLTARPVPDASAMIADRVALPSRLAILSVEDRACHAVAHLFADGDLAGGLRNLWDIRCLLEDVADISQLSMRAARHGLVPHVERAQRLVDHLYGSRTVRLTAIDRMFVRRLLSTNGWGHGAHKITEQIFYLRSHWLRMPPMMLARHLWTKWRKGHRPV